MRGEPSNLYADSIEPVRRTKEGELFLVRMEARPNPDTDEALEVGGAFVNCWVDVDDLRSAELGAIALIQENEWTPVRFEHWDLVCRECYASGSEDDLTSLQQIEQAFADGSACTFNCWAIDAPDA